MGKPLSQQRKEQDGYRPPFTILDEMYEDMIGEYRPSYHAKPPDRVLIVDGVLYKGGERLEYGEQIEPLDKYQEHIRMLRTMTEDVRPDQLNQWADRCRELSQSIATPMNGSDTSD
ncbi:hypothetical protein ABGV40_14790 [Paenibacillus amylolyticus]|uniref:hypothetical protein n=1 Tax=Paenibacillus amylolyticus TaxID=1451 RepID=UPI003241DEED